MDNKEQARVKAEAKCLRYAYTPMCVRIRCSFDRFEIINYDNEVVDTYKFVDIKDGDLCLIKEGGSLTPEFYFEGGYYCCFENGKFEFENRENITLHSKTGFNILEPLEEKCGPYIRM